MPALAFPPFPDDVPTHPLLVVDYELIKAGDEQEIEKLWNAATHLGFWYLKNHGVDEEVSAMFDMGRETMDLPLEEKLKFDRGNSGMSAGYKRAGTSATDRNGTLDTVEFINISKDDALAYPKVALRTYPSTVNKHMVPTIKAFVQKSIAVNNTFLLVFEQKLGLPTHTLLNLHPLDEPSGSEARAIKNPPPTTSPNSSAEKEKAALGAHTDFGSLSFLHNRLGGLQVLPPGCEDWQYVLPLPGHAICNVGDALTFFSGGILRSSMHRVVPPPGEQRKHERWSVVFFTRPADGVRLRALVEVSEMVRKKVEDAGAGGKKRFFPGVTAAEWFARRVRNRKIENRTGPETWRASRGTEHRPDLS